jgi:predicted metal-dependent phosphoesterase TrpH
VGRLSETHGLLVLRGNEIITDQGDVLVFGYHEEVTGVIKLERLREAVQAAGGFTIMAHPFRGFLVFDPGKVGLTVEQAAQRPMFQHVDALEVGNGKVTEAENRFAAQVAQTLNLPGLAGSDAHETGSIGQYATWFYDPITSEADLVAALRSGRFEAVLLEE